MMPLIFSIIIKNMYKYTQDNCNPNLKKVKFQMALRSLQNYFLKSNSIN